MFTSTFLCLCFLSLGINVKVHAELFSYQDFSNIRNTVLPDEWTSVRDCPVRYVDHGYNSQTSFTAARDAYDREFAHMAAIGWTKNDTGKIECKCWGSLITENFILTAAHCTSYQGLTPDVVRLGDFNFESLNDTLHAQQFTVVKIIKHPDYSERFRYHDLALLKLNASVSLHDTVCPACIWNNQTFKFKSVEAFGYDFDLKSELPQKINLTITSVKDCESFYPRHRKLTTSSFNKIICAEVLESGKEHCPVDNGSPLVVKLLGKTRLNPFLLGVASFGSGCSSGTMRAYVRLSGYIDWLKSETGADFDPIKCVHRYAEYREFEPDIVLGRYQNIEPLAPKQTHIDIYSKYYKHLVEIGWVRENGTETWPCMGTIITERFVLTSASCILKNPPTKVRTTDADNSGHRQIFNVERQHIHSSYNLKNLQNDIALIKLETEAKFGENLKPTCLWSSDELTNMQVELVSKGPLSAHTMYTELIFDNTTAQLYVKSDWISRAKCKDFYNEKGIEISENQLCYGNSLYLVPNTCDLAPGGPANRKYSGTFLSFNQFQLGINVYSEDCGFGSPAILTRVSRYIDWIDSIIFGATRQDQEEKVPLNAIDSNGEENFNIYECAKELRDFRKPVSNDWPPEIDDHYSTSHIAVLQRDSTQLGVGVLITDQHVLASKGVDDLKEANEAVLGSKSKPVELSAFTISDVKSIENAFLLFKLSDKVTFSQSIVPACLWLDKTSVPFDGLNTFSRSKENETHLDMGRLRPYHKSDCQSFVEKSDVNNLMETTSCAKSIDYDTNLCGYWNGSFVQAIRNESNAVVPYLVGMREFVTQCDKNPILFFHRVARFIDLIIQNL